MDVRNIVRELGGPSAVARHLKSAHARGHISTAAVCRWTRIPAERVLALCEMSNGRFSPSDLRPDIFGPAPSEEARAA